MHTINNKRREANWKDIATEFQSERDSLRGDVRRMQEERDLVIVEMEAFRKDAERYRFLREYALDSGDNMHFWGCRREDLDYKIDEVRRTNDYYFQRTD